MISDTRDNVEDIYLKITSATSITDIVEAYQVILHNLRYLSNIHLAQLKTFLNDFYIPTMALSEILGNDIIDNFNSDPCHIIRLKNLLTDLYDHSQSKSGYGYIALKGDQDE